MHVTRKKEGTNITVEHLSGYDVAGQAVMSGPQVMQRKVILNSMIEGDMELTGHFGSTQDILRHIHRSWRAAHGPQSTWGDG